MPDAAEVDGLLRKLRHRDDLGEPVDATHERVLDRLAEPAGERPQVRRREGLIAEEHHEMLQPRRPDAVDRVVGQPGREVDAADHGPERARDRGHVERPGGGLGHENQTSAT